MDRALCLLRRILVVALFSQTSFAEGKRYRFPKYRPLSVKELFAERMRFSGGEPAISVGILEKKSQISVSAKAPSRLMFQEESWPKTVFADPGSQFQFRVIKSSPAEIRYWVVVGTFGYRDAKGLRKARRRWSRRGYKQAKVFELGSVLGVRGNVLDTRRKHFAVFGTTRLATAKKKMAKFFSRYHTKSTLHEELVRSPGGLIGIYHEGKRIHVAQDSVYFGTAESEPVLVADASPIRGKKNRFEARAYRGHLYVVVDRYRSLSLVNSVGAEEILRGLVPAEMFPKAPLEALKAQAVTARGEIFSKLGHRHFAEPFHLCSRTHCQVYSGIEVESERTSRAVTETRGLLAFQPRTRPQDPLVLVDSVYSAVCGGFSEANEVVWGQPPSQSLRPRVDGSLEDPVLRQFAEGLHDGNIREWLEAVPPTACARASFSSAKKYRWRKIVYRKQLDRIGRKLAIGPLKDLEILGRGRGGRVTGIRLVGKRGTKEVLRELPIRRLFGNLNSGMFVADVTKGGWGYILKIEFLGGGWGHGVGLCQMGAIGRAERNQTFSDILAHYYNGAVVRRIYGQ